MRQSYTRLYEVEPREPACTKIFQYPQHVPPRYHLVGVTITCYLRRPEDADKGQLPLAGRNLG
jgi:hypothetical protein